MAEGDVGAEAAAAEAEAAASAHGDAPAFSVLDALGGCVRLVRRSPTLDGSVPLRAAQGCVPLLDGNAFGLQVTLTRPIVLRKRLGRWQVERDPFAEHLRRLARGAVPILRAREDLRRAGEWDARLGRDAISCDGRSIELWTGLLVRPHAGRWLWLQSTANRRPVGFGVRSRMIPDPSGWVPLVLEIVPDPGARILRLQGELATLASIAPGVTLRARPLAEVPEIGQAHLQFYTPDYFEAKRQGQITRRYRKQIPAGREPASGGVDGGLDGGLGGGLGDVAVFAPPAPEIVATHACLLPDGPAEAVPDRFGRLSQARFGNAIDFRVTWDGHTMAIDPDREALAATASHIDDMWRGIYGAAAIDERKGALWYLTKYFTPHPAGEPHFFVKPWALTRTPPGWSCVIDGEHGAAFDVMRGVVHSDAFFATPAVFQLRGPVRDLAVKAGQPLLRVTPVPRALLEAGFELQTLDEPGGPP